MPDLPTVTVTNAQMQRLLRVFGDETSYRDWLVAQLKAAVLGHELAELDNRHRAEREQRRAEVSADLDSAT